MNSLSEISNISFKLEVFLTKFIYFCFFITYIVIFQILNDILLYSTNFLYKLLLMFCRFNILFVRFIIIKVFMCFMMQNLRNNRWTTTHTFFLNFFWFNIFDNCYRLNYTDYNTNQFIQYSIMSSCISRIMYVPKTISLLERLIFNLSRFLRRSDNSRCDKCFSAAHLKPNLLLTEKYYFQLFHHFCTRYSIYRHIFFLEFNLSLPENISFSCASTLNVVENI